MRSTDMIPVGVFAMMLIAIVGFMVILFTASQTGVIEEQPPATIAGDRRRTGSPGVRLQLAQGHEKLPGPMVHSKRRTGQQSRQTPRHHRVRRRHPEDVLQQQRRNLDNRARPGHNRRLQAHQRPGPQPKYHDERMPVARARTQIPPKKTIKNSNPGERP